MGRFNDKERAQALLSQMSLKEKIGQLSQEFYGFNAYEKVNGEIRLTQEFKDYVLKFGGLGTLANYFRADPWTKRNYGNGITLEEREKAYNLLQEFVRENTRLQIPVLMEEDAPHGRVVLDGVMYPTNIGVVEVLTRIYIESNVV